MAYRNSDEELIDAVNSSKSYRQTLIKLGLNYRGAGNYKVLKNRIKVLKLDITHFSKPSRLNLDGQFTTTPLEKYLILNEDNSKTIATHDLKKRLIKEGVKEERCEECGIKEWNGENAPLELHHCNENPFDNRLENLRILCANCHAVEHKKIRILKSKNKKTARKPRVYHCTSCDKEISKGHKLCLKCLGLKNRRANRPSKEDLENLIEQYGYSKVGKMYNVSDNAIRKWLK